MRDGRGIGILHITLMAGLEVVKQPISDGILVTMKLIKVDPQSHDGCGGFVSTTCQQ